MSLRGHPDQGPCAECLGPSAYLQHISDLTWERLEAVRALRVTVLSGYMRDELVAVGADADRIAVIPPFVAPWPSGPAEQPSVLFAGRLVASKGVFDALEAHRLADVPWPLVFAGTGSARARLERAGARVLGWLDRPALARWLRGARVLVMPSRWQEPFGIVGLEALSLGTPVAAWKSGGVAEWHPGGEGLVAWGDVAGLARAIASLGEGATPSFPRGFARGELLARWEALYRRVAARR